MSQTSLRVEILGHEYPLRVDEADAALTREVAAYVDERMHAFRNEVPGVSDMTHAVLSALAIAEELHLAWGELERLRTAVGADADALAERLDEALAG
ncbi:MAG: cell division protein ZapA [Bacteroidota bacterium]